MAARILPAPLAAGVVILFVSMLAGPVEARGGFSRISAASGGFSAGGGARQMVQSAAAQPRAQGAERLDSRHGELGDNLRERADQIREKVPERVQDRNDWRDYPDDYDGHGSDWDDHWFDAAATAPAAVQPAAPQGGYVTTLPCSGASVVVNDDVYYECHAAWYRRGFLGGTVVYITSAPPPGYLN